MRYHLLTLLLVMAAPALPAPAAEKPNIVFILADDLGWADVAFHGGKAPTPNLDKLARENLELTHHYVAPVCSPTRTAFMTGRYWSRYGVTTPGNERALPWETVTLPRALKSLGYDTALTGKWHLGSLPEQGPNHFGFDHSYGSLAGGVSPYLHVYKTGPFSVTWHRDEKLITEQGHVTDLITKEATEWIAARTDKPFFLYVPFTAVHLPVKEPREWLDKVPSSITGDVSRHYAACIMHLDDSVGKIISALEKAGKREQTLLIFTSDNGGSTSENADMKYAGDTYPKGPLPGNNKPLRGQKADIYDGGMRVPAIVSWPNHIQRGKVDAVVHISDWMPTFCAITGYQPEKDLRWDGINVSPLLPGKAPPAGDRTIYAVGPNFRASMIRVGGWKLIRFPGKTEEADKFELYHVAIDPTETNNVIGSEPAKAAELKAALTAVAKADRDSQVHEKVSKKK